MKRKKKILICPLDWGLGHATRCVPLIRQLLEYDVELVIGAANNPLSFLKKEFPNLQFIDFPGYDMAYPKKEGMVLKMLFSIPHLLLKINQEHRLLDEIILNNNIDAVISDNRYGLWSRRVKTVFVTHQIRIKSPFLESLLFLVNKSFINKFDACWVPDFPGEHNLSGALAHGDKFPQNIHYIGPLSRFSATTAFSTDYFEYDALIIISGPEPQRSIFEHIVLTQLKKTNLKVIVVLGKPAENATSYKINQSVIYTHLETVALSAVINKSKLVISRPGYSTIMDMAIFSKKCIFVPTPGQTEQEYLAQYFHLKRWAYSISQAEFNLEKAIDEGKKIKPAATKYNGNLLQLPLSKFVSEI